MPLELTLLDDNALPPLARRAVSSQTPAPMRLLAARGMAPMPPADLVVALYQLALGEDEAVAEAARKTAGELPDAVLGATLAAPLDPRVLDFFGRALLSRPKPLGIVLANAATSDETFAVLGALGGEGLVDQIARNEQRLLRHPAIITSIYLNRRARMSTAMRAVELAVRNGVEVEGIPGFEEVKAAIEQEGAPPPSVDAQVQAVLAMGGESGPGTRADGAGEAAAVDPLTGALIGLPTEEPTGEAAGEAAAAAALAAEQDLDADHPEAQNISQLPMAAKLRLCAIGGAFARSHLVRDANKIVALAAIRSPALTEQEAERYAGNRALYEEVVRYLANQRHLTKRYPVKLNLVNNPKCPLSLAIGFLGHLTARDLKSIARSKSVPSALTQAAQNLLSKREGR